MLKLHINSDAPIAKVEPEIYGHFTEHIGGVFYDGIWVGEDSKVPNIRGLRAELVEKLRAINAPVIRWPGGCFAEIYDWRDGIGPRSERPVRINWWNRSDGRYEPNAVGTDEFIDFCRLTGAEPYIAANITSTTPLHIRDWIDYCNSPAGTTTLAKLREKNGSKEPYNVKYWGVGNETWGGGGDMTGETYAHEYRKYAEILNNTCAGLELICSGANHDDWRWAKDVLGIIENSGRHMAGFSLHFYCGTAGTATEFTDEEYYRQLSQALDITRAIDRNWGFVVGYGLERHARLVIDEWGCWHKGGSGPSSHMKDYGIEGAINNPDCVQNLFEQQSTMRDAIVAAATLNIFNNNAEKIKMATVAQLVNNLHCLFLAGGEYCICTPTYHVFDMMKGHMGGTALHVSGETGEINYHNQARNRDMALPNLSVSATIKDDIMTITAANLSVDSTAEALIQPTTYAYSDEEADIAILTSDDVHDHNMYEEPDKVKLSHKKSVFDGHISVPPYSVVTVTVKVK